MRMKFIWLLVLAGLAHAAGTSNVTLLPLATNQQGRVITEAVYWNWTGDASTGSVPSTVAQIASCCTGWFVLSAEFVPGTPAPTNGYGAAIKDSAGIDILAGASSSLSSTISQAFPAGTPTPPVQTTLTLTISGQTAGSGTGTVIVFLVRPGTFNSASLLKGGGGGGGSVNSVFGRTGAVSAGNGDYTASQVTNAAATNAANSFTGGFLQNLSADDLLVPVHAVDPGTCSAGQIEFNSTAQTFKGCTTGNTWGPFGSGGGNGASAAIVTLSFSATPTFTCPDATKGTVVDFQAASNAAIILTGNITSSTLASCTPGSQLNFLLKQDATGGRTVSWPSGFPPSQPNLSANATTTMSFYWDGANARILSSSDSSSLQGTEGAAPAANPPAGFEYLWFDSTANTARLLNSAGNFHKMPRCAGTTDTCASTDLSDSTGVQNARKRALAFSIGDPQNSSALTTSNVAYVASIPFACTISAYNLAIDAGTITVKFWKVATGTAIPTSGNSISTSGVSISSGTAIHSTTVTDFTTTTVSANDIMAMAVTAVATAKFVSGVLECDN